MFYELEIVRHRNSYIYKNVNHNYMLEISCLCHKINKYVKIRLYCTIKQLKSISKNHAFSCVNCNGYVEKCVFVFFFTIPKGTYIITCFK